MYQIRNFTDNDDIRTLQEMGPFRVIEYTRDHLPVNMGVDTNQSDFTREQAEQLVGDIQEQLYETAKSQKRQVICTLGASNITLQAGAMQWMLGDVHATTGIKGVGDLFGKAVRGKMTGESAIKPEYTGNGLLVLEPTYKHILLLDECEFP